MSVYETIHAPDLPLADEVSIGDVAVVSRSLPLVAAGLRARYPGASAEVVEAHVRDAAAMLIARARIYDFLPILIERSASETLRHATS